MVDGEVSKRYEVRPVVAAVSRKTAQNISDDNVHALDLAGGVVVMRRSEDKIYWILRKRFGYYDKAKYFITKSNISR